MPLNVFRDSIKANLKEYFIQKTLSMGNDHYLSTRGKDELQNRTRYKIQICLIHITHKRYEGAYKD